MSPVQGMERTLVADAALSMVRHDVRGRLSTIRNAVHYLERKLKGGELWETDARVAKFFALIVEEIGRCSAQLEPEPAAEGGRRLIDLRECIAGIDVAGSASAVVDVEAVRAALRILIDDTAATRVELSADATRARIGVVAPVAPGRLAMTVARRLAQLHHGEASVEDGRVVVTFAI